MRNIFKIKQLKLKKQLKLCLVTSVNAPIKQYTDFLENAVRGGVTMVQLREKDADMIKVKQNALAVKKILKPFNVPLIINDFVHLANEINADGVHIGQGDMSVSEARDILGPDKIIGLSIESIEEIEEANLQCGISYVTASAVFPSLTKKDCKTIWGLDGLNKLSQLSKHPVTAIGGVNECNVTAIIGNGACGVALVGAIHRSIDPYKSAKKLLGLIDQKLSVNGKIM